MNDKILPTNIVSGTSNAQQAHNVKRGNDLVQRALDEFYYEQRLSPLQKSIKQTALELWKEEMKMPEELFPSIRFQLNPRHSLGGAVSNTAVLEFPKMDDALKITMMMGGGEKCVLRHELQHVKQDYEIVRLIGVDAFEELLGSPIDKSHYELVVETLGRISKNSKSKEAKFARKCYNATKNYVSPTGAAIALEQHKGSNLVIRLKFKAKLAIDIMKYHNNFTEKDAKAAAKPFKDFSFSTLGILKQIITSKLRKIK